MTLSDEDRKVAAKRQEMLNNCDIAFLCLPDDAARESVSMIENENVTVIEKFAIYNGASLRQIDGLEKIVTFGDRALMNCSKNASIEITSFEKL